MPDTPVPSTPPASAPGPSVAPKSASPAKAAPPSLAVPPSETVAAQVQQLQTGHGFDEAAEAVAAARKTAQEIASDIHTAGSAESPPPPPPPCIAKTAAQAAAADAPAEHSPPFETPSNELRRLLAIEVPVIVQLGARRMTVAEVMRFAVGAIIEFSKSAEDELELLANNKAIGKGARPSKSGKTLESRCHPSDR